MKTPARLEIAAALLLAGGGLWFLATRPLDDRLDTMLPQDPALLEPLRILEDARLSGRVILHVQATTNDFVHADFASALDRLVAGLQSPTITAVTTPANTMPAPEDIQELLAVAPQLLDPSTYAELEQRLTPDGIGQALAGIRRTLLSPHAFPMTQWFRRDPLGARATALKPLELLGKTTGFQVNISNGHFFSEDRQSAMLILETPVRVTDHAGSVRLVDFLRARLEELPTGLHGTIIAAHLHTLSNQRIIRRDIGWTSLLATLFFGGMFLIYYRDARSAAIFAIPAAGILMGLAVIGLTGMRLAAVVLGMCSLLVGIAIDYAIHVYVALSNPTTNCSRDEAIRRILPPLWLSALTTLVPFLVLTMSTMPGYRQLGILASSAILFSLLLATRIMPLLFPRELKASEKPDSLARATTQGNANYVLGIFLFLLVGAGIVAAGIQVDLDFSRLNGAEAQILQNEADFFARWGKGPSGMGMVAVVDQDPEITRQANDAVYRYASLPENLPDTFISLAPLMPSAAIRRENAAHWIRFWEQHGRNVRVELSRIAPDYGFAEDAFAPFFDSIHEGTDAAHFATNNRVLVMLGKQFAHDSSDGHILLSFYADTPENNRKLAGIPELPAKHLLISRRELQAAFASSILRDLARQAAIAVALIAILILYLVRPARSILLVLIPPVAGATGMLAGLRLMGHPLTPISMLAGFLMVGICFDYGVFMLQAWRRGDRTRTVHAIHLAWLTTAGGASLLLIARHPVLHSSGLALALGVTCGYLTSRWVLWAAAGILRVPILERAATR